MIILIVITLKLKSRRYCLEKCMIQNLNFIINGKNFCDQPIVYDIKRYEKMRKLTTGQDYLMDVCQIMITSKIIID